MARQAFVVSNPVASGHAAIAAVGHGRAVRLGAYGDPAAIPSYVNESLVSEASGHTAYSHQLDWAGATGFDAARMMVSADSLAGAQRAWDSGARTFRVVGAVREVVRGREVPVVRRCERESEKHRDCGSRRRQAPPPGGRVGPLITPRKERSYGLRRYVPR